MKETKAFYCTKPSDITCHSQCEQCARFDPAPVNQGEKILRWVKVSDNLPKTPGKYFVQSSGIGPRNKRTSYFNGYNFPYYKDPFEWLEELDQPAAPDVPLINEGNNFPDTNVGDIPSKAKRFALWLDQQRDNNLPLWKDKGIWGKVGACERMLEKFEETDVAAPTKEGAEIS